MADVDQLFLVQWEDRFMGVISASDIVSPIKTHYQEGEIIQAKYQKKTFNAAICDIHPNAKYLRQQSKLPPKHPYDIADGRSSAQKPPAGKPLRPDNLIQRPADQPQAVDLLATEQTTSSAASLRSAGTSYSADGQLSAQKPPAGKPLLPDNRIQRPADHRQAVDLLAMEQTTNSATSLSSDETCTEHINLVEHSEDSDVCRDQSNATGLTREEFNQLMDDVRSLRRRVRKLESERGSPKLNADHEESLFSLIESCDSESEAVEKLLLRLFDIETIVNSSVSGKRANSKVLNAKKPLDYLNILKMKDVMKRRSPNLKKSDLTARIHSVQKNFEGNKRKCRSHVL